MRLDDNASSCSQYFQAGLLIFALLAVFSINSVVNSNGASRALMEIQGEEVKQGSTDTLKKMEERNRSKDHTGQGDGNATAVVKVEEKEKHGLIALNNDCIKSLMKVERASSQLQKSLTSYSDNTYASNYPSYQEGILLCQLRMPKP